MSCTEVNDYSLLKKQYDLPSISIEKFYFATLSLIYSSFNFSMLLQSEIYQEEFKKNFVKNLIKVNENKNSLSRINFFDENIKKILFDQDQGKAQSIGDLFVRACLLDDISQERSFDFYEKNIGLARFGSDTFSDITTRITNILKTGM